MTYFADIELLHSATDFNAPLSQLPLPPGPRSARRRRCPTRWATRKSSPPSRDGPAGRGTAARRPRCPSDASGPDRSRRDLHLGPFSSLDGRPQGEQPLQHGAAVAVNVAGRRADLGVGVAGQRFLDEIDESGLALQRGQQRDRLAACRRLRRRAAVSAAALASALTGTSRRSVRKSRSPTDAQPDQPAVAPIWSVRIVRKRKDPGQFVASISKPSASTKSID